MKIFLKWSNKSKINVIVNYNIDKNWISFSWVYHKQTHIHIHTNVRYKECIVQRKRRSYIFALTEDNLIYNLQVKFWYEEKITNFFRKVNIKQSVATFEEELYKH